MTRLLERYKSEVAPELGQGRNPMEVAKLTKVVVNMGVGEALKNEQELNEAVQDLGLITGQKPRICKARKSVATWRLREGSPIGAKVTMRGQRMWEFVDRFVSLAVPRIKDFRGLNPKSFDGHGNYSVGIVEKAIFAEVNQDKMQFRQGLDVTFVTSAKTDAEAFDLLKALGFPFRK